MIYTLRVECVSGRYLNDECVRVIEIDEGATLLDLHYAIQRAVRFDNDHLFSFFLAKSPSRANRIPLCEEEWEDGEWDEEDNPFSRVALRDVFPVEKGMRMYYWFDFGDSWMFEIKKTGDDKEPHPKAKYPRVTEKIGPNPKQY
jgi:hypothetical protein